MRGRGCLFGGRQIMRCAVVLRGSFFRIMRHWKLRVVQSFIRVLNVNKGVLLIYPGGIMMPIIL